MGPPTPAAATQNESEVAPDHDLRTQSVYLSSREDNHAPKIQREKSAIESMVRELLTSYRGKRHLSTTYLDTVLDRRLHLCKLTHRVFDRSDTLYSRQPHRSTLARRRRASVDATWEEQQDHLFFLQSVQPTFCRRHHRKSCMVCKRVNNTTNLGDTIPVFLKTSADMLRKALESESNTERPLRIAGQPVMGGGMPPQWYDLFLDFLTQAAIETFTCDGWTGPESIVEIFSYGKVTDEDEDDEDDEEEEADEEDDGTSHSCELRAEDHHLLFPKTRTMFLFKTQLLEREKELLNVGDDGDLAQHLEQLTKKYPPALFEKSMVDFIEMILDDMDLPALARHESVSTESFVPSSTPEVYQDPCDGSLLIPEVPDDSDDDTTIGAKRSKRVPDSSAQAQKRRRESTA